MECDSITRSFTWQNVNAINAFLLSINIICFDFLKIMSKIIEHFAIVLRRREV